MCGIFALIKLNKLHKFNFNLYEEYLNSPYIMKRPDIIEQLLQQHSQPKNIDLDLGKIKMLNGRGPDYQNIIEFQQPYYQLLFHSLLHMRGNQNIQIKQPLQSDQYILQYNGEIYNIKPDESDTLFLMNKLKETKTLEDIQQLLLTINGDYSFIFHDQEKQRIIICKDPFGKRSLLLSFIDDGFILSSQALQQNIPFEIEEAEDEDDDGKTVDEKYLMKKYLNEFNQAINKTCIELENNSIIEIKLAGEFIEWNKIKISNFLNFQQQLIQQSLDQSIDVIQSLLMKSTKEIVQNIFGFQEHFLGKQTLEKGKIGILFSGGIDCSLITHMVCQLLPENSQIDLINVAFTEDAPDRITAQIAYQELQSLHPNQLLNLVLLNKTLDDVYKEENEFLEIIYPKITHMDFNIAMILNIASQYNQQTRVLLSGLGADEIFCGYARYKHALKRGEDQLLEEMNFDLFRLWNRNLGRDDRAVSKNGKELRFPFLNIELVQYIRQYIHPSQYIMGDTKSILRIICVKEGLKIIQKHSKKAIQFGTKIAKLSNKRFFGGNKRAKGTANYNIK